MPCILVKSKNIPIISEENKRPNLLKPKARRGVNEHFPHDKCLSNKEILDFCKRNRRADGHLAIQLVLDTKMA